MTTLKCVSEPFGTLCIDDSFTTSRSVGASAERSLSSIVSASVTSGLLADHRAASCGAMRVRVMTLSETTKPRTPIKRNEEQAGPSIKKRLSNMKRLLGRTGKLENVVTGLFYWS